GGLWAGQRTPGVTEIWSDRHLEWQTSGAATAQKRVFHSERGDEGSIHDPGPQGRRETPAASR
ncbi:MAG: hypothetical protein LC772_09165, partial [Chloroflexi bacterium]|nr:hypothetical protein [Chloroflexota bacterium]